MVIRFAQHNQAIDSERVAANGTLGELMGGLKKDVVISNKIVDKPNNVVIYGWHKLDGTPIQPLYNGHINSYLDYSHGIRFINNEVLVDSVKMTIPQILKDPILYKILSNENGPMIQPSYIKETEIEKSNGQNLPKIFQLYQNYPNPFNPTTTIKYSVPSSSKNSDVSLIIYDILGNKIAELVNEVKSTGNYQVKFDASKYSSGVYFCVLNAGNFLESKKLIFLK